MSCPLSSYFDIFWCRDCLQIQIKIAETAPETPELLRIARHLSESSTLDTHIKRSTSSASSSTSLSPSSQNQTMNTGLTCNWSCTALASPPHPGAPQATAPPPDRWSMNPSRSIEIHGVHRAHGVRIPTWCQKNVHVGSIVHVSQTHRLSKWCCHESCVVHWLFLLWNPEIAWRVEVLRKQ